MTGGDDRVKEFLEHFIGFFVTSDNTTGLNVGMSGVVDTSLNAIDKGDSVLGLSVLQFVIDFGVVLEEISHEVRVFTEVGHFLGSYIVSSAESGVFLFTIVRCILESTFDPFGHGSDGISSVKFGIA